MPHFQAAKLVILHEKDLQSGFTLEQVYEVMKDKQFPIKFRKGAVSYEIGMLVRAYLGRDSIVADIGFDPNFALIYDKEFIPPEEEGEEPTEIITVNHLEWTT